MKRFGIISCDSCGRDFTAQKDKRGGSWTCPHCGFDNVVGREFAANAQEIAAKRAAEARASMPHVIPLDDRREP